MNGYTGDLVTRARVAAGRAFGDATAALATLHKAAGGAFYASGLSDGADDAAACRLRVDVRALDNQVGGRFRLCTLDTSSFPDDLPSALTPLTPIGASVPPVTLAARGQATAYYDMPRGTPEPSGAITETADGIGTITVDGLGVIVGTGTQLLTQMNPTFNPNGFYITYETAGGPQTVKVDLIGDELHGLLVAGPYDPTSVPDSTFTIIPIVYNQRQLVADFESAAGAPAAEVLVKAKPYCFPGWKLASLTGPAALRAEPGVVNSAMGRASAAADYQFEIDAAKDMIARRLAGDGVDLDMIPTDGVVLLDATGPQAVAKYLVPELVDAATYLALHLIHVRFLSHTDDFDAVKADRYARMFEDAYDQSLKTLPINIGKGLELTPDDQRRGVDAELEL